MTEEELAIQLPKLIVKIPYDEDIFESEENYQKVLKDLLESSKYIALETLFPFDDFEDYLLPKKYYNWQLRCCIELYNLADKQGLTNYSENSLSWAKLTDGLSKDLMSKLTSRVGIPKKNETGD